MLRRGNTIWARLTPGNRAGLLLGAALIVMAATGAASRLSEEQYTTLRVDLARLDAGSIVNRLSAQDVSCRVTDGGTILRVPIRDAERARLIMTSQEQTLNGGAQDKGSTGSSQEVSLRRAIDVYLASKAQSMQDGALWVLALLLIVICLHHALVHLGRAVSAPAVAQHPDVKSAAASREGGKPPVKPARMHPADAFRGRAQARPDEAAEIIKVMMRESTCP